MPIDLLAETEPKDLLQEQLGPVTPKTGFLRGVAAGAVNVAGALPSALGGITGMSVEDQRTGLRGASLAADEYASQVYQGPTVDEVLTDPSVGKTWDFIKGEFGKQVAPMAASLAAGAAGARAGFALPLPLPHKAAAALVGGVGGMALPTFGFNIGRQTQEQEAAIARGEAPREYTPGTAAAAAPVQAALDRIALGTIFKGTKVGEILGGTSAKLTDKQLGTIAERGLLKTIGVGAARTAAVELPTEITQQAIERAQAGLPTTGPEAMKEYRDTAITALAGVTPIGAGAGVARRSAARTEVENRIQEQLASTPLKEEIAAAKAQAEESLTNPEKLLTPEQAPPSDLPTEEEVRAKMAAQESADQKKEQAAEVRANQAAWEAEEAFFRRGGYAGTTPQEVEPFSPKEPIVSEAGVARHVNDVQGMWKQILADTPDTTSFVKVQHLATAIKGKTTITEQLASIAQLREKKSTTTADKARLNILAGELGKFRTGVPNAIQEPSATAEIPRTGETRENIPVQSEGVRPVEQGIVPAQEPIVAKGNAPVAEEVVPITGVQLLSKIVADAQAGKLDGGVAASIQEAEGTEADIWLEKAAKARSEGRTAQAELYEKKARQIEADDKVGNRRDATSIHAEVDAHLQEAKEARSRGDTVAAKMHEQRAEVAIKEISNALQHHIERARAEGKKAAPAHTLSQAKAMVTNITSKWTNAPKVRVEKLEDLLPAERQWLIKNGFVAFYNTNTREVVIASDLHDNLSDVKGTLFHEALGHYGLRDKFRRGLDAILWDMYSNNPELKALADAYLAKDPSKTQIYAMEEVLAISQERGKMPMGWFAKIIAWVRAILRPLTTGKLATSYTMNDVRYILRQAHETVISGPKSDYVPTQEPSKLVGRALKLGFSTPESAARATDAVLTKVTSLWDNVKPVLQRTYLYWSQLTHIADMTENLIPMLKHWGAEAIHPIRDKINNLMTAAAIAKELTHEARVVYHQMEALLPKQQQALFTLMGKYQLAKVFPNMPFEDHKWIVQEKGDARVNAMDRQSYREAKHLYDQPGVKKVYDAAYQYNQRLHDVGMASVIKSMGQIYGVPEYLWRAISAKEGMNKNVAAVLEYAGLDSEGKVLPDEYWTAAGGKKPALDYTLQGHIVAAMSTHQAKKAVPYFHLGRDGDYMVNFHIKNTPEAFAAVQQALSAAGVKESIVVNPGDTHVFSMFETEAQMRVVVKQLALVREHLEERESMDDEGKPVLARYTSGLVIKKLRALDGSAPSFIRGMLAKINEDVHLDETERTEQQELLRRLYIDMLPETNQKFYARRAGTPGYSSDMARSFVKRAAAGAYYAAQHATRPEQNVAMARLREARTAMGKEGSPYYDLQRQTETVRVINELNTRTANILTPLHTPGFDRASAIGHTFFLTANMGYVLQNLAQPYQLTLPYLGGRHGFRNSASSLGVAFKDAAEIIRDTVQQGWRNGKWMGLGDANITIDRATHLSPGDRDALKHLIASGRADWTQAGELTKLAEGANRTFETTLKVANSLAHYGEILNRMQTGLAAYRLEMKRSNDTTKAHAYMVQAVDDTQINYAVENRSRAISKHGLVSTVTPVATLFMQYSIGVTHLLAKLVMQAHGGETKQERKEAAKALGGILVSTSVAAGTLGLPFVGILMSAYNNLMGDEDEPPDAKSEYQNFLTSWLGQDAAQVIAHGPINFITGADVASRVSYADILPFTRLFATMFDGRMALRDRIESGALFAMGPVVSGGANVAQGLSKISDGDLMGGLKQLSPGATKGPFKALDLYNNGFTTSQGVKLPMEATSWDMMVQGAGFTPTKEAIVGEAQRGFDMKQRALSLRSSNLTKRYVRAVESQDSEAQQKVMGEAQAFMLANPGMVVDFGAALRKRAQDAAIAKATGSGVIGATKYINAIQEQTQFAQQP